jgi:hypothetical protein
MLSKDKASFVLYTNFYEAICDLPYERKGILLDVIFEYEMDLLSDDKIADLPGDVKMAFRFIRGQLDKDKAKWAETCAERSEAGLKGAKARWQTKAKDSKPLQTHKNIAKNGKRILPMAKMPDYDTDYDTEYDIKEKTIKEKSRKNLSDNFLKSLSKFGSGRDIVITDDYKIDFTDSDFCAYKNCPPKIVNQIETWVIRNHKGECISKNLIIQQFTNFSQRQGINPLSWA